MVFIPNGGAMYLKGGGSLGGFQRIVTFEDYSFENYTIN